MLAVVAALLMFVDGRAGRHRQRGLMIDGDTIEIDGQQIGHGIASPESRQTCLDDASQKRRYGEGAMSIATNGRRPLLCGRCEVNWMARQPGPGTSPDTEA